MFEFHPLAFVIALVGVIAWRVILSARRLGRRDAAARAWLSTFRIQGDGGGLTAEEIASRCYGMADAMERARRG